MTGPGVPIGDTGPLAPAPILLHVVPAGSTLVRICREDREPLWFGPAPGRAPEYRFDAPHGEYRVCYLGASSEAAFAETFLRRPPVRLIARSELATRLLVRVRVARDLSLAALYGSGLARAGVTGTVTMAPDYDHARRVGVELWRHPLAVDGICYQCRHDSGELAIALFNRAHEPTPAVVVEDARSLLADARQIAGWANRYRFGLI